ncbi:MAG: DUF1697 domain-containing protein [Actinomycetota bacterium]|nr:DUF1697 domain-containing protein [Actinomycetota bacterium]
MATVVALLRGVNVGGRNTVPMADLRRLLAEAGYQRVRTYIQSGNVVLDQPRARPAAVAAHVHNVIAGHLGLDIPVIALSSSALAAVTAANPYGDEPDPRRVHVFFLPAPLDAPSRARLDEAQAAVAAKGSRDRVHAAGTTMYLHTPDGFGRSDLASALMTRGPGAHRAGTARNLATVAALVALCGT